MWLLFCYFFFKKLCRNCRPFLQMILQNADKKPNYSLYMSCPLSAYKPCDFPTRKSSWRLSDIWGTGKNAQSKQWLFNVSQTSEKDIIPEKKKIAMCCLPVNLLYIKNKIYNLIMHKLQPVGQLFAVPGSPMSPGTWLLSTTAPLSG